jgi:hypothetical protein
MTPSPNARKLRRCILLIVLSALFAPRSTYAKDATVYTEGEKTVDTASAGIKGTGTACAYSQVQFAGTNATVTTHSYPVPGPVVAVPAVDCTVQRGLFRFNKAGRGPEPANKVPDRFQSAVSRTVAVGQGAAAIPWTDIAEGTALWLSSGVMETTPLKARAQVIPGGWPIGGSAAAQARDPFTLGPGSVSLAPLINLVDMINTEVGAANELRFAGEASFDLSAPLWELTVDFSSAGVAAVFESSAVLGLDDDQVRDDFLAALEVSEDEVHLQPAYASSGYVLFDTTFTATAEFTYEETVEALSSQVASTVQGKKFQIRNPRAGDGEEVEEPRRVVVILGKEKPTETLPIRGDPTISGATLQVLLDGATPSEQTFTLGATGWSRISGGFKFQNAGLAVPVKKVVLKRSGPATHPKALLKLIVKGNSGTDPVELVPPNPTTAAGAVLTIVGGDTFCVNLGGDAGGEIEKDDARQFKAKASSTNPGLEVACAQRVSVRDTDGKTGLANYSNSNNPFFAGCTIKYKDNLCTQGPAVIRRDKCEVRNGDAWDPSDRFLHEAVGVRADDGTMETAAECAAGGRGSDSEYDCQTECTALQVAQEKPQIGGSCVEANDATCGGMIARCDCGGAVNIPPP